VKGIKERKRDKREKKRGRERRKWELLSEEECRRRINSFNAILLFPHSW